MELKKKNKEKENFQNDIEEALVTDTQPNLVVFIKLATT